jgi:hypothetical protein
VGTAPDAAVTFACRRLQNSIVSEMRPALLQHCTTIAGARLSGIHWSVSIAAYVTPPVTAR